MRVNNHRKARYAIGVILSFTVLAGLFFLIDGENAQHYSIADGAGESITVKAPELSKQSGFYSNAFYLKMSAAKGCEVYYTLDGSEPDESATKYTEPIFLENATSNENVYSMRTDVSTGFYTDLIEQRQTEDADPHFKAPDYSVDKCNIVRAISVDEKGNKSDITTASYFVGISPKKYNNCNILSLVSSPDNLFDESKGIYVTGATFDRYKQNRKLNSNWRLWSSNYSNRGEKWERPASFELFNSGGKLLLTKDGGIRIQGGISRGMLPRSFNLFSRSQYDNSETFNYALFKEDDDFYPHSVTLAAGGNQTVTQFNDVMMSDRTKGLDYALMDYEPFVLFIDGEYWGFYRMASKVDEYFIQYKYGVDKDNVAIIKNGALENGTKTSLNHYQQMKSFITDNDMRNAANYEKACEYMDIDSYLDYYATQIYIARQLDWPMSNFALWRTVEKRDDKYSDGKWRWIMFDSNSISMNAEVIEHNTLEYTLENDEMFASLWENEEFKKAFKERITDIANRCFDAEEMDEYIDSYSVAMQPILSESWKRYYGKDNSKSEEFELAMNGYKAFFDRRKAVVEAWFE